MTCLYCLLPEMESVQCSMNDNIISAYLKEHFAVYQCSILTALLWYLFMQHLLLPGGYASTLHEAKATRTSKNGGWVPEFRGGINLPFENRHLPSPLTRQNIAWWSPRSEKKQLFSPQANIKHICNKNHKNEFVHITYLESKSLCMSILLSLRACQVHKVKSRHLDTGHTSLTLLNEMARIHNVFNK